jgi:hypothetical protein
MGEGGGPEDDSEMATLLDNMMNQLMTKDVLYEPLKELGDAVSAQIILLHLSITNLISYSSSLLTLKIHLRHCRTITESYTTYN